MFVRNSYDYSGVHGNKCKYTQRRNIEHLVGIIHGHKNLQSQKSQRKQSKIVIKMS
jgi:hypothetical protein